MDMHSLVFYGEVSISFAFCVRFGLLLIFFIVPRSFSCTIEQRAKRAMQMIEDCADVSVLQTS